jgi:signal transduction histidine kinase
MSVRTIRGNLLFWKITLVFTGLLLVLGLVFVLIASRFSTSYYTAAHQELYGNLAQHLAQFTQPFKNNKPDTTVTHDILHSTMVANPSVEVYLLDTTGNIVDYVVPDTTVQIRRVSIAKVRQWLAADHPRRPMGDNPKQPDIPSIFSAAPVYEVGRLVGYVYVVLASEKQQAILHSLSGPFYVRLATYIFFAALIVAFLVGVVTFFLITDSICRIAAVVSRFKAGDYTARIQGRAKGNLGMLTSTFNEMADVIVDNMDKLSATDKLRQELIANVSHDLRTPLSIMQGYVETLLMKKHQLSAAEQEQYLSLVYNSNQKLAALVEQLFQYARLEANLVTPQKESFLLDELVADICAAYQLRAREKHIHLQLDAEKLLPPVFADIGLTERVFQNLLDNALKFTPPGGSVTIQLSPAKPGVQVRVTDTGIGIAPEHQPLIFERYKQFNGDGHPQKGMGIGLAIVRKIIELHQATIDVVSQPGKGTVFGFFLPAPPGG